MAPKALILIEGHRSIGPLYVRAGLYPITMSTASTQYAYLAAEGVEAVQVDTNELDAMTSVYSRLQLTHDIAGLTGFSDLDESVYVTVGKLCRHYGLPGPTPRPLIVRNGDYRDLIGHVIAASPTRDQTAALLQQAVDLVS